MLLYLALFILIVLTVLAIAFLVLPRTADRSVRFTTEPDAPMAFGEGMAWLAIRSEDTAAVMTALGVAEATPANWAAGIATIYDPKLCDAYVFVTPPIGGWTLVAGVPLPLPASRAFVDKLTPLLARLGAEFSDVQYFASYPVIDLFAWSRVERGRIVRAFAIGDEGIIWDRGRLTREERALGLKLFELRGIRGRKGDAGEAIILHPTEEQVRRMANGWSLDPLAIERDGLSEGTGYAALPPVAWRAERLRKAA